MFYDSFTPLIILIWIVSWILSTVIGVKKGQGCISVFAGLILGPIWLFAVLLDKGNMVKCRYCQKSINKRAIVCPYCRSQIVNTFRQPQPPIHNNSVQQPQRPTQDDDIYQKPQTPTQDDSSVQQPQRPNQDNNSTVSGSSLSCYQKDSSIANCRYRSDAIYLCLVFVSKGVF